MSTELKMRRDVEGDIDAMTPAEGESIYDITNKRLRVGDGSTAGGLHLSAAADLTKQTFVYAAASGTDTLTLTLAPAIASYTTGLKCSFKAASNNTGTTTIAINGLAAKTIKKNDGADDLEADDLVSGVIYDIVYDGTNFQIQGHTRGWEVIESGSVSNAATLDITDLIIAYRAYRLVFDDLLPASDAVNFNLRTDANNGASFEAGASDYSYSLIHFATGGAVSGTAANTSTAIVLFVNIGSGAGEEASGIITIFNPMGTGSKTQIKSEGTYLNDSGNATIVNGGGGRATAEANNAFQLLFSAGNISTMNYTLYGLRAS